MKKRLNLPLALITLLLIAIGFGCKSPVSDFRRSYMLATDLTYGGYVGYTNWYLLATNGATAARLEQIETDRLKLKTLRQEFAATVDVADQTVAAYQTNSAVQPMLSSLGVAMLSQSSNYVWLVNFITKGVR